VLAEALAPHEGGIGGVDVLESPVEALAIGVLLPPSGPLGVEGVCEGGGAAEEADAPLASLPGLKQPAKLILMGTPDAVFAAHRARMEAEMGAGAEGTAADVVENAG
jgi:hypothetical protein